MTQTTATLQRHLNEVMATLSTTTEILSKLAPSTKLVKEKIAREGNSDANSMLLIMSTVVSALLEDNRKLIEEIQVSTGDAEMSQMLKKISDISHKNPLS